MSVLGYKVRMKRLISENDGRYFGVTVIIVWQEV